MTLFASSSLKVTTKSVGLATIFMSSSELQKHSTSLASKLGHSICEMGIFGIQVNTNT